MKKNYDVVVIGAGSGGLTAAVGLAKVGKKVLLVEREHLGGECTNSGCIPSKALLHHAKAYAQAVSISGTNGNTENYKREAFSYVRSKIAETLSHETPAHFEKMGISVVMGEAVFTGKKTIRVGTDTYQFKKALIATGSSPRTITVPGLETSHTLTNQNIFTLNSIPARTLIIGAGPISMELGQALAYLGSQVTILDNGPVFAKLEDPAIQPIISQSFSDAGITILQNTAIKNIAGGVAYVDQTGVTEPVTVPFDKILIAIGRIPNIPEGLVNANINHDSNGITVNKNYQTTNPHVYALGDVADRLKFTHQADDVARGVVTRIATYELLGLKTKAVPKVTYTEPEIAQVGLSQTEAADTYGIQNIHRIEVPFSQNDRARTDNAENGVVVVIVKRLSGKILGAHIVGARAGELIALFTLAIDNNLSLWKLRRTIYAYPTYALLIKKAGDYFFAQQIGSLKTDIIKKMRSLLPKAVLIILWAIGLIALTQYQQQNNLTVTDTALRIFDFITLTAWGPMLYILAYTIRPITFLPGTALTILSGVFFGLTGGIIYTIIGANLSATLAYCIGRFFSGTTREKSNGFIGRFAASCRENPFTAILTMRLIFLPFDGVNYGAGFLKIPYMPYITATIIGTLLGIATFVAIGAAVSIEDFTQNGITAGAIDSTFLLLSALVFIISIGIARLLKK
jgi:pyruvate/2-oxoglutarate dehydrogenase complex dihydrolipoamide dehydrogenase (E3) component/uncharacterized membrane protein YdjX (TVP38/TMEM64 family)